MINHKRNKANYLLAGLFLAGFTAMLLPSCVHEPTIIADPTPIDTTGNPIDTTGIPVDTPTGTPCDPNVVYFSKDILPLLISNCAKSGCHDAISHEEDIVLDNFQNVIGSRVIKAFDVNDSELIEVITDNDPDDRMPPSPAQRLSSDQIAIITKWVQQGAKDLTCDENAGQCVTTNISYSGYVAPVLTAYCVGCHSGGAPSGGISLGSYANVKVMADNGKLYGAINWASGYKAMPQGSNKLSECRIAKIKGWIDDGAPNN